MEIVKYKKDLLLIRNHSRAILLDPPIIVQILLPSI